MIEKKGVFELLISIFLFWKKRYYYSILSLYVRNFEINIICLFLEISLISNVLECKVNNNKK